MSYEETMRANGYIPATEVAAKVGRSMQAVYRWVRTGKVRAQHSGGRWFVEVASLITFLGPVGAEAVGLIVVPPPKAD